MDYLDNYLPHVVETLLDLLANGFMIFCRDLAVFIFSMLVADIQRSNWKSAQGPNPVNIQLFNPYPLYSLLLL